MPQRLGAWMSFQLPPFDIGELIDLVRECPLCAAVTVFLLLFGGVVFWFIVN